MKKLYIICFLFFVFVQADAQTFATTTDGRKVILYANGNWRYADRNNNNHGSTDFMALYEESYNYAYDIIYGNEFFSIERSNKANQWAKEYVSRNLYIPIGTHT